MPLYDYRVFQDPTAFFSIQRGTDIPAGFGSGNNLRFHYPILSVSRPVSMIQRIHGGVQRGSHELDFFIKPNPDGFTNGGGVILASQSSLSNKRLNKTPLTQPGYVLDFPGIPSNTVRLRMGLQPSARTLFTAPVPGLLNNWARFLFQVKKIDAEKVELRVRYDLSQAMVPTWSRVPDLPDIQLTGAEILSPGFMGLYGVGDFDLLVKFFRVEMSEVLTQL